MFDSDFIRLIESNADLELVEEALIRLTRKFGVVRVSSVEIRVPLHDSPFVGRLLGKRDTEYVIHYRKENFGAHDVAIKRVLRSADPFSWKTARPLANTPERKRVFEAAKDFGYGDGWVVPNFYEAGGVGATSFVGDQICDSPEARHTLTYAGSLFYRYAQKKTQAEAVQTADLALTARQSDVAYWISHGKTDKEIAVILGIAHRTVNRHMEDLRSKFSAGSRTEVIAKILKHNLFDRPLGNDHPQNRIGT